MERKLNVPYSKQKWSSQPELLTNMGLVDTDRELYLLATLSGINFDFDVFKILVDLLRQNVNPNSLLDVLRKIANQSSSFSNDIATQAATLPNDVLPSQSKDVPSQSSSLLHKSRSNLSSSSSSVPKKVIKKRPMSEILYSRDSESGIGSSFSGVGSSLGGAGSSLGGVGSSLGGVGSSLGGVGSSLSGIDTFSTMSSYSSFLSDLKDKKESRQSRSVSDM